MKWSIFSIIGSRIIWKMSIGKTWNNNKTCLHIWSSIRLRKKVEHDLIENWNLSFFVFAIVLSLLFRNKLLIISLFSEIFVCKIIKWATFPILCCEFESFLVLVIYSFYYIVLRRWMTWRNKLMNDMPWVICEKSQK